MIRDENISQLVSEMLITLQEAASELMLLIVEQDREQFQIVLEDMLEVLCQLHNVGQDLKKEESDIRLGDTCKCAYDSLKRIEEDCVERPNKALDKIEFELIPILKVAYVQFRYWACAYPDKEKIKAFNENEVCELVFNPYIKEYEEKQQYKYEVSIIVIGYNKLDYTKQCVESLLKNIPNDLNYELILFNHGSTDGTKEYFETINPTKQIDISINGATPGIINYIYEGKYFLAISNDIIITENAISNMLTCIKNDDQIGWVIPTTPNISNYQSIPASYKTRDELELFAKENNKFDFRKHEQRVRLCNPVTMSRSILMQNITRDLYIELYCIKNTMSFTDDKHSLWLRRHNYKLILAKDAYCHHFGSITIKDEIKQKNENLFYLEGRKIFYENFGVDPWGIGCCYDYELFQLLQCNDEQPVNILGINCGLGSNPLKVKDVIKENNGNEKVVVYNIIEDNRYYQDLAGVSTDVKLIDKIENIREDLYQVKFDYIIIEENIDNISNIIKWLENILKLLSKRGKMCIKVTDTTMQDAISKHIKDVKVTDKWCIIQKEGGNEK